MDKQAKSKLLRTFKKLYIDPQSELVFADEYQLLVCVMLSAQSTDRKVNEVTPALFAAFPTFNALSKAKVSQIEKFVRPVNYYITKAKNLSATAKIVSNEFAGRLPRSHEELISLPGVGNKTANVVLAELRISPAFPVDTHVFRVSHRLGLAKGKTPHVVESELKLEFDSKHWRNLHHFLILHGRRVCKARNPLCPECGVNKLCPSRCIYHPELNN